MAIQSIEFEITKDGYTFKDAIVYDDSTETYTTKQIESIKQARFDDWYAIVTAPSEEQPVDETPVEE